jgi:hypothetical protein
VTLFFGFFVLLCVWSTLTPLFSGPDEPASYIRGAAIIRGEFVGSDIAASESTSYWSTNVDIPQQFGVAQLVPWCFVGKPDVPACSQPLETLTPVETPRTDLGRYPPVGFIASGLGSLVGPTDLSVYLGRIFNAFACALLLAISCVNVLNSRKSLLIILAAVTPGVLFLSSVISSSSIEISASICLWSGINALLSNYKQSPLTINSVALSALLLALSRPVGIISLAIILTISIATTQLPLASLASVARNLKLSSAVAISFTLAVTWYFKVYSFHLDEAAVTNRVIPPTRQIIEQSLSDLTNKISESIGNYGWLDTPTPMFVVWFFFAYNAFFITRNLVSPQRNSRMATIFLICLIPIFMMVLNSNFQNLLRTYGVQGRHLTPLIVGLPLISGINWHPPRATVKFVIGCWSLAVFMTGVHVIRRYSVGIRSTNFFEMFSKPVWTPPLGIAGSLIALALALLALSMTIFLVATKEVADAG